MVIILNLKEFLKTNRNARKIFGKKEIEIMIKQLDGIALTQSEKNRLSRDIRPKLRLINDLSQFKDKFELKKDAGNLELINKAVDLILEDKLKEGIKAILLFGSHVNGIVTARSDIDICVLFKEIFPEEADKFRIRIMGSFSKKMDIQVFNALPQKIKMEIAKSHRILYKNEEFDNALFTVKYLKDEDYFIRMKRIIGEAA